MIFLLTLIVGMVISRKKSFSEGFYFFLIMILSQVHSYVLPFYTNSLFDYYQRNIGSEVTLGEVFILISYIDKLIAAVAFVILVIGIFKRKFSYIN